MNIFFLDKDPKKCAEAHHDKHVVKMILETAQLLSTAHRVLDGVQYIDDSSGRKIKRYRLSDNREQSLYKATHMNHPSAKWVRESSQNYKWTFELFNQLLDEYTMRYGKFHKCADMLLTLKQLPKNIKVKAMTEIPQAMPDYCKNEDSIVAYRTYYINEKKKQSKYTNRKPPYWLV